MLSCCLSVCLYKSTERKTETLTLSERLWLHARSEWTNACQSVCQYVYARSLFTVTVSVTVSLIAAVRSGYPTGDECGGSLAARAEHPWRKVRTHTLRERERESQSLSLNFLYCATLAAVSLLLCVCVTLVAG